MESVMNGRTENDQKQAACDHLMAQEGGMPSGRERPSSSSRLTVTPQHPSSQPDRCIRAFRKAEREENSRRPREISACSKPALPLVAPRVLRTGLPALRRAFSRPRAPRGDSSVPRPSASSLVAGTVEGLLRAAPSSAPWTGASSLEGFPHGTSTRHARARTCMMPFMASITVRR